MDQDQHPISYRLRNFERLSGENQDKATWITNSLITIWSSPYLKADGAKDFLLDDISVLVSGFGARIVQDTIDWLRQNHEKTSRPTIQQIRSRCSDMAGSKRKPQSAEMDEYFRELKARPENFMPVALIVRDVVNRVRAKRYRTIQGNPMSQEELDAMRRQQEDNSRREWLQMIAEGRLVEQKERPRAHGEKQMSGLFQ